jgi:integrase
MPAYKDTETKTWYVQFYYKTFTGENKKKKKRGFRTKKEALEWENDFKLRKQGSPDMPFGMFWQEYKEDLRDRLKETTWEGKIYKVDTKILPHFNDIPLNEIDERSILKWQNWILSLRKKNGEPYAQTYIKSINNELSAIINHAVRFYNLPNNPIHKTGSIGQKHAGNMDFYTLDEFNQFIIYFEDDPLYNLVYNLLYYTGIRQGEMLALTLDDFDIEQNTININKNWGVRKRKNAITTTKTKSSNRVITFPIFILDLLDEFIDSLYDYETNERLFSAYTNKGRLNRKLKEAAKSTGVKPIRVHDLRHSHASLLVEMDVNIKAIQERLGHQDIETTLNTYSHLYPTKQQEVADMLNKLIEPK